MPPWELTDIAKQRANEPPGLADIVLIAQISSIAVFPALVAYTNPGDSFRLTGNITFITDEGWVEVYARQNSVKAMLEQVGQHDSKGFNFSSDFFHPSLSLPFAELLKNDPDIIVALRRNDCTTNTYWIFGDLCRWLKTRGTFNTGAAATDEAHGWEAKVEGYLSTWYEYTGTITMKP